MPEVKRILVTGDYGFDYDLYLPTDEDNPSPGSPPANIRVSVGGAGIALRVLKAVEALASKRTAGKPETPRIETGFGGNQAGVVSPPVAALWQSFNLGKLAKTPADEKKPVWRIRRSLSLGAIADPTLLPSAKLPPMVDKDFKPNILLVEDNVGGFRFQIPEWLKPESDACQKHLPEWIILKTNAPVCYGAFWWALSKPEHFRDRLIIVVSVEDLRRSEIRVSQGISWERTAQDLSRELSESPLLEGLRRAKHVIVTLRGTGALWMQRKELESNDKEERMFTLFFDPGSMEGEWIQEACGNAGDAYGYHSTFAAAVTAHLALDGPSAVSSGIRNGLRAMRLMRVIGHGLVDNNPNPEFPDSVLASVILGEDPTGISPETPNRLPVDLCRLGEYGCAILPPPPPAKESMVSDADTAGVRDAPSQWRILEANDSRPAPHQPLYGLGRRVALLGLEGLKNVPYANFGNLFTADRSEIEALRNIQRLMQDYENNPSGSRPLSIAVFGPPGSGKSFAIQQIAETALQTKKSFLEFNLSQFSDNRDLIGAFHQVRDKVLEGGIPIVFWDEFDSQEYKWLQYLLAPMQDGKFQEGQITHPIGKCIFVFGGATCYSFESFGPPEKPWSQEKQALQEHKNETYDFRLRKGPDFKSRLHGSLNVLGPNRRQCFHPGNQPGEQWADDPTDVCFPVRRAILLRSWLGLMDPEKKQSRDRLNMDPGLIAALLEVDHYSHGARSMEKIVTSIKQGSREGYHRSALPSDEVLEMNVREFGQFIEIMNQSRTFQQHSWRLAPAIHAAWFELAERENAYKTDFALLGEEAKGDNYAAAVRIPAILGLVGLQLVENEDCREAVTDVASILENHLELLAEEEHNLWMEVKKANGWTKAPRPKDQAEQRAQRDHYMHHCLLPYSELPDEDKDKDRKNIRNIPTVAELANFKIVARMPMNTQR